MKITNLQELVDHFDADEPRLLNRRIYKDTSCGASISVQTLDGKWHHSGYDWSSIKAIQAFTIQTIVEGSDAEINCPKPFTFPVESDEIDKWVASLEEQAAELWSDANEESDEHGGEA